MVLIGEHLAALHGRARPNNFCLLMGCTMTLTTSNVRCWVATEWVIYQHQRITSESGRRCIRAACVIAIRRCTHL